MDKTSKQDTSYSKFEATIISLINDYFIVNHIREVPENINDKLNELIQTENLLFKEKFIKSATSTFLHRNFPILSTQQKKDDMITFGYKFWKVMYTFSSNTIRRRKENTEVNDQWLKNQYVQKMIIDDDLTNEDYLDFLFGVMFVDEIKFCKEEGKSFNYGHKYNYRLSTFHSWKLSKSLMLDILIHLIKIRLDNKKKQVDYQIVEKSIRYFPVGCELDIEEVIKELESVNNITIIGFHYPVSQNSNKTVKLPLVQMKIFSNMLDGFPRKLYPIDIIDIFHVAFGFYPKYAKDENVYGIISDCYIGKRWSYEIVIENSPPKNNEYEEITQNLNEKIIRYLADCTLSIMNLSLYISYFSIFAFAVDKEDLSNIDDIVKSNGIRFCSTNQIFIDECVNTIRKNITKEEIYEQFLYDEYRNLIAPQSVFVNAYIPSILYSEFKAIVSEFIPIKKPKPIVKNFLITKYQKLRGFPNLKDLTSFYPSRLKIIPVSSFDSVFNATENNVYLLREQYDNFATLWLEYSNYVYETITEIESFELLLVTWRSRNFIKDLQNALMLRDDEYMQHSFYTVLGIIERIDSLENMDYITFYRTYLGFFLFLSNKSIVHLPYSVTKYLNLWPFNIEVWLSEKPLIKAYHMFNKRRSLNNKSAVYSILATSTNIDPMNIREKQLEDAIKLVDRELLIKSNDNVIKKIRDLFASLGNIQVLSYEEDQSKILSEQPVDFLDDYKNKPEFKYLCKSAKLFMENNSQSIDTRKKEMQLIVKFLKFLEENHFIKGTLFEKVLLEPIFSGDVELSLHHWINGSIGKTDQNKVQNVIAQICERSPYLAGAFKSIYRKNYSKQRKNSMMPSRYALDEEVLLEMRNIVLNDPPKSTYYERKIDEKSLWYSHVHITQPMLPAMLLLHIKMPHRAEHIRTLDLNKFFIRDVDGNLLGLEISTDKNWRRADVFTIDKEVVNIMFDDEELNFIQKCNEYIYQYFDQIRPVYQKGDAKNIWGQIVPMFPNNLGTDFIPKEVYRGYYFKVLIKALLSLGKDVDNYIQAQGSVDMQRLMKNLIYTETYEIEQEAYLSKKLKSKHYGPHSLRKSNITRYISYGHPLEVIIAMTGHKSLNTIMSVYIDYSMLAKSASFLEAREVINKDISIENPIDISKEYIKVIGSVLKAGNPTSLTNMLNKLKLSPPPSILDEKSNLINNEYGLSKCLEANIHVWKPMPWGICTTFECPTNIVERCSACPYLLTNELFMRGIKLAVLVSTSKIAKIGNSLYNNMKESSLNDIEYSDHTAFQKDQIIEFYSWQLLIDDLHEKIYNTEGCERNALQQIAANQVDYNMGLIEIFTEAKACYYGSRDVDTFTDELAGKVLKLLVQKRVEFNNIPFDNQESLLTWFIDYLDNSSSIERENIIKSLKDPENNFDCLLSNKKDLQDMS